MALEKLFLMFITHAGYTYVGWKNTCLMVTSMLCSINKFAPNTATHISIFQLPWVPVEFTIIYTMKNNRFSKTANIITAKIHH